MPFNPFRAAQVVSLIMMAVLIAPRVLPPLRPYARPLAIAMVVVYFAALTVFFIMGFVV